jgi:hypothetical protein
MNVREKQLKAPRLFGLLRLLHKYWNNFNVIRVLSRSGTRIGPNLACSLHFLTLHSALVYRMGVLVDYPTMHAKEALQIGLISGWRICSCCVNPVLQIVLATAKIQR